MGSSYKLEPAIDGNDENCVNIEYSAVFVKNEWVKAYFNLQFTIFNLQLPI
jgi:hypothetical protein